MPYLKKQCLAQYIRTGCLRQLRLNLTPPERCAAERAAQAMPDEQPPRPGLEYLRLQGEDWQAEKLADLTEAFGPGMIVGQRTVTPNGRVRYAKQALTDALRDAVADRFLVEAEYTVTSTFERALGIEGHRGTFRLEYASVRPDIIQVLPQGQGGRAVTPRGDIEFLSAEDARLGLRVIDVKLTAEPSPSYFAEIAYYAMVLAAWLEECGLADRFVVVPNSAVWPGSHDRSALVIGLRDAQRAGVVLSTSQLRDFLESDLEPLPFEVFAPRVRRFLNRDVPEALAVPSWTDLEWHVNARCKGCEYLGHDYLDRSGQPTARPDHCLPTARAQDHLSRVAFISRGSRIALQDGAVTTVSELSLRAPDDRVFGTHQSLRAMRTVVSSRARSLRNDTAQIADDSGTSAVMPRWADLRVYVTVDFDVGSAITLALGLKAFWIAPLPRGGQPGGNVRRATQGWRPEVFVVDEKDLVRERREVLAFLRRVHEILTQSRALNTETTVQFYIWDEVQYEHLVRLVGRHLPALLADRDLRYLAWLFPADELVRNPRMATRRSPITIVNDVVRAALAAPVPHYYSLLEIARRYHDPTLPPQVASFSVHPLFADTLSDQVPSERAHEIWARITAPRHWAEQVTTLTETVRKRLAALETVTRRLESDLRARLSQAAPAVPVIGPIDPEPRMSADGQLWYAFSRLDAALAEFDVQRARAMPPHEREARFRSARLIRRLEGEEERLAFVALRCQPGNARRVYEIAPESREVKVREGDFSFAVAPRGFPGFLDLRLQELADLVGAQAPAGKEWTDVGRYTGVSIVAIDRDQRLLAFQPKPVNGYGLDDIEAAGFADFSIDAILDPTYRDFFTPKLREALRAIGNPPAASTRPIVLPPQAIPTRARLSVAAPPAELLWDAHAMHDRRIVRDLGAVRRTLESSGFGDLNESQWAAWDASLARGLSLIWGPPGTGKSRTAVAVVLGAALDAHRRGTPIRILVCAATYQAMDNVLLEVYTKLADVLPGARVDFTRVRSYLKPPDARVPVAIDLELNKANPSAAARALRTRLEHASGIHIVGATENQVHNLMVLDNQAAQQEFFDLILIDEASQMDVPHAILALASLAGAGAVVLAGDPKQLPPIHQAEAPLGLEAVVGSVYEFCAVRHGVPAVMLNMNYRSNDTIVRFALNVGYERTLRSAKPTLALNLLQPIPADHVAPPGWPNELPWSPEWGVLLEPTIAAACFVYQEGRSSQWNRFEADCIAALTTLLAGHLGNELVGERPGTPPGHDAYSVEDFWAKGVGIVTPHRAQQGLIVARLQTLFPTVPSATIRDAVDTVERFQGQQRDAIIASYALGDPDMIASEDEFLLNLNRFNVMASRARAKLIVLVSQEVVDHLCSDIDALRGSGLLKTYVDSFCRRSRPMSLPYRQETGRLTQVSGDFRVHG